MGSNVFLSNYAIDLNFLISPQLLIDLATPTDALYNLEEILDLANIHKNISSKSSCGRIC